MMSKYDWMRLGVICGVVGCSGDDPDSSVANNTPLGGAAGAFGASGGAPLGTGGSGVTPGTGGALGMGGTSPAGGASSGGAPANGGAIGAGGAPVGGMSGMGGGSAGTDTSGTGGEGMAGSGGGDGTCCPDGNCICRGEAPTALTGEGGPYTTDSYDLRGTGCVYFPTDADPPFSAVAIADGLAGSGGCGRTQTDRWGPFYASHGIVTMIVETGALDQPPQRGDALLEGIEGFKAENENSSSHLYQKLAGRYGTSGFSMGGGGTTHAATDDTSLLSSVGIMAWSPVGQGVTVPTLFICGSTDGLAGCGSHGSRAYGSMPDSTPKMIATVSSGHVGQPSAASGRSGALGLAFQKVFLDGDERWRPILLSADYDDTNIQ